MGAAGIDTSVYRAHSVRGAASSAAARAGMSTADILQCADWAAGLANKIKKKRRAQETNPLWNGCVDWLPVVMKSAPRGLAKGRVQSFATS